MRHDQDLEVERWPAGDPRDQFFRELGDLWMGHKNSRGDYMLGNDILSWDEAFGHLEQEKVEQLHESADGALDYVKTTYVARKKVKYDITMRGRKKLHTAVQVREIRGDPLESLKHRVGIFLGSVWARSRYYDEDVTVETYADLDKYTPDILAYDDDSKRPMKVMEVVTNHHNYGLYDDTFRKLVKIGQRSRDLPVLIFSDRNAAYTFFNHMDERGKIELPNGRFDSNPNIEYGREQTAQAFHQDTPIDLIFWTTFTKLWNEEWKFGHEYFLSADW